MNGYDYHEHSAHRDIYITQNTSHTSNHKQHKQYHKYIIFWNEAFTADMNLSIFEVMNAERLETF